MLKKVDVREVWDTIKPALERLSQTHTWIPEDVYSACVSGQAFCFVDDEYNEGCLIVELIRDRFDNSLSFHIWIAVSWINGAIKRHWEEIKMLARQAGCDKITFHSKRKGMERAVNDAEIEEIRYKFDLR